jgi:hypothetical protein
MLLLQLQNSNPNTNAQNTGQPAPPGGANAASLKSAVSFNPLLNIYRGAINL